MIGIVRQRKPMDGKRSYSTPNKNAIRNTYTLNKHPQFINASSYVNILAQTLREYLCNRNTIESDSTMSVK